MTEKTDGIMGSNLAASVTTAPEEKQRLARVMYLWRARLSLAFSAKKKRPGLRADPFPIEPVLLRFLQHLVSL